MHRKLFDLARANAGKGAAIRSEVAGDTATIYVYDVIDPYWGVSASDFVRTLSGITAPNIALRINCPGGDVFEARAMMAAIAEHPATVTAKIDGLAASAATALTLACDSVEIVEGGFYMIHKAWTFAMGNADDLRTTAELLDKVDGVLADGYAKKTGKPVDEIVAWMTAETWFTSAEALEAGFADKVMPIGGDAAAKASARAFDVAAYGNAPKALVEAEPQPDWEGERARLAAKARLYNRLMPALPA